MTDTPSLLLPDLLATTAAALDAVARFAEAVERGVASLVAPGGKPDAGLLDRHQIAAHGFAWVATYAEALRQMHGWGRRLDAAGRLGELESALYLASDEAEFITGVVLEIDGGRCV